MVRIWEKAGNVAGFVSSSCVLEYAASFGGGDDSVMID